MKWFKHDANAMLDAKLKKVRIKYGMEGYGLYWYCLELVAQNVEPHNLNFELEHDAEIIAHDTGIHYERVSEMMIYMVDLGLFESSRGVITCLKLAARTDEYTQQLMRNIKKAPDKLPRNSLSATDKVRGIRIDKNRTEDNKTYTPLAMLVNMNVNKKIAQEWLKVRRTKKLTSTQTAFNVVNREAEKAGLTMNQAVTKSVEESWGGFKAEWLNNQGTANGKNRNTSATDKHQEYLDRLKAL